MAREIEEPAWLSCNRANWDERVSVHVRGGFYDVDAWRAGRESLQPFEIVEVGEVKGRSLVHLQCHFGMDTLSWARRGAQVTGLDFSPAAVEAARGLAEEAALPARFVCANVYDAVEALGRTYEIVYTTHGVLGWLPDLRRWAEVVDALLRPGGFVYLSEFHPVSWCLDPAASTRAFGSEVEHDYFASEPLQIDEAGTYADRAAETRHNQTVEFQHTLGEIVSALCERGFVLEFLRERDHTLFPQLSWLIERPEERVWVQPPQAPRVPLMFSLRARKPR